MSLSTSNSRPRRAISPVLSNIPWYTTVIRDSKNFDNLSDAIPSLKSFLGRLESHDELLFSLGHSSYEKQEMYRLLGVELSISSSNAQLVEAPEPSYAIQWTPVQAARVCALLSAYRLVDVTCLVEGLEGVEAGPVARREVQPQGKFAALPTIEDLRDWPSVLLALRTGVARSTHSYTFDIPVSISANARLIQWLSMNHARNKVSKVECNLLVAAIHLSSLVKISGEGNILPDIPDTAEGLVNLLCKPDSVTKDASELADANAFFLRSYCEECRPKGRTSKDLAHLRSPLLLALWISPLCLFAPVFLSKNIFHKQNLINTAVSYGNRKPDILLSIEKTIWKSLFHLSNGFCDPASAMMRIMEGIPWAEVQALSASDVVRSWFVPTTHHDQPPAAADLQSSRENSLIEEAVIRNMLSPPPSSLASSGAEGPFAEAGSSQNKNFTTSTEGEMRPSLPSITTVFTEDHNPDASIRESPPPSTSRVGDSREGSDGDANMDVGSPLLPNLIIPTPVNEDVDQGEGSQSSSPDGMAGVPPLPAPPIQPVATRSSSRLASKVAVDKPSSDVVVGTRRPPKRKKKASKSSSVYDETESEGDNPDIPIDVDAVAARREPVASKQFSLKEEEDLLDVTVPPSRLECEHPYHAYDASGTRHEFSPSFHHADYYLRVQSFMDRVEAGYIDGKPLHLSNPSSSVIALLDYSVYNTMSVAQISEILRSQNIVVTGYPTPKTQFDKNALRELHNLKRPVSIQDYSYGPIGSTMSASKTVTGTVNHLLESAAAGIKGKILNALEFPASKVPHGTPTFLTDLLAWDSTRGAHNLLNNSVYPAGDMFWGLAGTADSVTFMHIDSDGLGTGIQVMCGSKIWGLYRERESNRMTTTSPLLHKYFFLDQVTEQSDFDLEAIVIRPGDLLIMRPNTPHFVFGPQNTICHGFHFYNAGTMQSTLCGIIHTFVLSNFITNISHPPTRHILRRLLIFFFDAIFQDPFDRDDPEFDHVPDVSNLDGILDLLSLCNLVILGNVLDYRTYSAPNQLEHREITALQASTMARYDQNDIPWDERMSACYARGIAITILRSIQKHFVVEKGDNRVDIPEIPARLLARQIKALLSYKKQAELDALEGAPHCTVKLLEVQVNNVIAWAPEVKTVYEGEIESLHFGSTVGHQSFWRQPCLAAIKATDHNFLALGTTPLDRKFFSFKAEEERPAKRSRTK